LVIQIDIKVDVQVQFEFALERLRRKAETTFIRKKLVTEYLVTAINANKVRGQ